MRFDKYFIFFLQRDRVQTSLFHSYMTQVTFKIRSHSPKPNHLLRFSQNCICASLVKIWSFVQKIVYRQSFSSYMTLVTLKIRSSHQNNHSFQLSQISICASFGQNPSNCSQVRVQTKSYPNANAKRIHTVGNMPPPTLQGDIIMH